MTGILEDKDRIFTNLYGFHDWRLEEAKKRGAWNGTADMLSAGGAWFRDGPEVDLHAQGREPRSAALPDGQRR